MAADNRFVTEKSTVGAWLAHSGGAQVLHEFAEKAGLSQDSLRMLRKIPVNRLLSSQLPDGALEQMVKRANGGEIPAHDAATDTGWQERITPSRFDGKTAVITGAGSGIGRAVACRIAREGGRVVAVDISEEGLKGLQQQHPDAEICPVAADIAAAEGVEAIVSAAEGRVDALGNVAGLSDDFSALHELSDEVLHRVFEVNVFGLMKLTRAVLPLMMEAGSGTVVNVASEAAMRGSSSGVAYTASKSAVLGVTRSMAYMYEPFGIRVNTLAPGGTVTGMRPVVDDESYGPGRIRSFQTDTPVALPEEPAASITFLLSDDSVNVTGALLTADGGQSVY
ncbi:NAD(P)-dependent dehydrogenase (short-subunit alcohol dehydrogenase family) [Prauserella sediminis]|uniref:NAD(P)-dependent dehydrogenase (Short-subunit alcohol dehydrogenase family) n=1 Tax=Prauserella sediminis TaxID=577680 RepID=A0A839XQU4_9PSEU|nr:SDR family oxidoreductase [Prauserella sediminis]MBB3665580.1 NAD(P)-dependent dehydrogenase (short-subunit alcohol dehydrogenase family) [Prauserella sediminis]